MQAIKASNHIKNCCLLITEIVTQEDLKIQHKGTEEMWVNRKTKPLPGNMFRVFRCWVTRGSLYQVRPDTWNPKLPCTSQRLPTATNSCCSFGGNTTTPMNTSQLPMYSINSLCSCDCAHVVLAVGMTTLGKVSTKVAELEGAPEADNMNSL